MSSRRLNRRTLVNYAPTSASSLLVGLHQLDNEEEDVDEENQEETIAMNENESRRRRRQSALSLAYSVDEHSRSSTFISSAETQVDDYELEEYDTNIQKYLNDKVDYDYEEDEDDDDDDDENRFQNPYYHPALPTPIEDPVPPPRAPQSLTTTVLSETREDTESTTTFQKFLSSPIEFIFGGNPDGNDDYDDDVSTLDGGGYGGGESVHWLGTNEEDSSTIRTTPTLQASQYKIRNQPTTIIENDENDDDDYDEENYDEYNNPNTKDHNYHPSFNNNNDDSNSLYPSKETTNHTSSTYKASKVRFGMMDEDVPRNHVKDGMRNQYPNNNVEEDEDEDVSISLSTAFGQSIRPREYSDSTSSHDNKTSIPKKSNTMTPNFHHMNSSDHSYSQQSSSSIGTNSVAIRRALDANKSWRSMRSLSKNNGTSHSSSSSISINGGGGGGSNNNSWNGRPSLSRGDASVRSFVSLLPETPEVIPNSLGGPVMTRGMSGRAVVHVQLDSARDGSITRLDYTMPIVDDSYSSSSSMQQRRDEFHDEYDSNNNNNDDDDDDNTVVMENKARNPWKEMYLQTSKFMRTWYSRKFQRILAMALLGIALLLTITISMTALLSEEPKSSTSTSRSTTTTTNTLSATATSTSSLHGLFAPPKIVGVTIPNYIDSNLKEWYVPNQLSIVGKDDVPYYFSIPHSGAQLVSECWTHCLGLTLASNGGTIAGADDVDGRSMSTRNATTLRSIQFEGTTFVNVDLSTPEGIDNAGSLNLIPSSIPDIVISPLFINILQTLYSSQNPTTLLMVMRHPVDRTVARFESWKKSQAETTADPTIAMMSIEQYALSGYVENNYVIRLLTGKYKGRLTNADVDYCKEILRRKAVLGLYENMEGTILHFQQYFGWGAIVGESDSISLLKNCQMPFVEDGLKRDSATKLDPGSSAYSLIQQQNMHDMALYQYIRNVLIPFQTEMLSRQRQESLS
jgi:hypothetical protein